MGNTPVRMFFWDMETKEPVRSEDVTITFKKLNDDGEYVPLSPYAVGIKVEGFQMLPGIKQEELSTEIINDNKGDVDG